MTAHTRGPWRFEEDADDIDDMGRFVGADGTIVCSFGDDTTYYPTAGSPPEGADRQLIAAAPQMLAVLLQIRRMGYADIGDRMMIDAAIARATGGQ
jgi:hypothetical protein